MKYVLAVIALYLMAGCGGKPVASDDSGAIPVISDKIGVMTLSIPPSFTVSDPDEISWSIIPPYLTENGTSQIHRVRILLNGETAFDGRVASSQWYPTNYGIAPTALAHGTYRLEIENETTGNHATTMLTVPNIKQVMFYTEPAGIEVNTSVLHLD